MKKILLTLIILIIVVLPLQGKILANEEYEEVDVYYVAAQIEEFYGDRVKTFGTVTIKVSYYMYEDFWLSNVLPVEVRTADLPKPPEGVAIEIWGTIEYSELEGGFYYLKAEGYSGNHTPEIPQTLMVPITIAITTFIALITRKNRRNNHKNYSS